MIKAHCRTSLWFGVPGFILAHAGWLCAMTDHSLAVAWVLIVPGVGLSVAGLCYAALAKGRSAAWGAVGLALLLGLEFFYFVGLIPLLLLACLRDEGQEVRVD